MSHTILKKHSTSSVPQALGCSSGRWQLTHCRLLHSFNVSNDSSQCLSCKSQHVAYASKTQHLLSCSYLFTSSKLKLCNSASIQPISYLKAGNCICIIASWINFACHLPFHTVVMYDVSKWYPFCSVKAASLGLNRHSALTTDCFRVRPDVNHKVLLCISQASVWLDLHIWCGLLSAKVNIHYVDHRHS